MKGIIGWAFLAALLAAPARTQDEHKQDEAALLKAVASSKHSLADGLKQLSKGDEVPISAKFEFDDNGKISLSIYTAEKGLGVAAENNVLKEFAGSPEAAEWKPVVEVFKDVPHVARSSQQLTLAAMSKASLLDVVTHVEKDSGGRVISIAPTLKGRRAYFDVRIALDGKTTKKEITIAGDDE